MTTDCQVTPSVATDFLVAGLDIVGTVGMTYRLDYLGCTESETCPTLRQDEFPVPFGPAHGPCISKFMEDCWCFGVGFGYERTDADIFVRAPEKRRSIEDRADSRTCKNVAVGGYDFLKPPWTLDRG